MIVNDDEGQNDGRRQWPSVTEAESVTGEGRRSQFCQAGGRAVAEPVRPASEPSVSERQRDTVRCGVARGQT